MEKLFQIINKYIFINKNMILIISIYHNENYYLKKYQRNKILISINKYFNN